MPDPRQSKVKGYEILLVRFPQPARDGEWIVRVYASDGTHVYSAEDGISIEAGIREAERAIHRHEHPVVTDEHPFVPRGDGQTCGVLRFPATKPCGLPEAAHLRRADRGAGPS